MKWSLGYGVIGNWRRYAVFVGRLVFVAEDWEKKLLVVKVCRTCWCSLFIALTFVSSESCVFMLNIYQDKT